MQFEDPQALSNAYLILRHLYDGDVIEWPIADDHPLRDIFTALEAQGYLARWDRTWPLHDRYRLTDKGIAAIEAVYQPAGAEAIYNDVRGRKLSAAQRRAYLQQQGHDPMLWPLLHDPSTHWDMYRQDRGRYYDWFWEDYQPTPYRHRHQSTYVRDPSLDDPASLPQQSTVPYVVDLDREANAGSATDLATGAEPTTTDYDVS
jgi:hypothetical protein